MAKPVTNDPTLSFYLDVRDSFRLAMLHAGVLERTAEEILVTVDDYVDNHYDDDPDGGTGHDNTWDERVQNAYDASVYEPQPEREW